MSDQPTLPNTDSKPGRPSKAEQDAREADLNKRARELDEKEANLAAQFEAVPRVSADEAIQKEHGKANPKSIRRPMGQSKRLDADRYIELHQDKKLMWVNDLNGDVQRWIDNGAEPVPVSNKSARTFEGITDKVESKWVRAIGGDDGMGGHFWVYLLMCDPDVYHEVKIAPERERQQMILRAMQIGGDQSDMGSGPALPSYAPNLPSGGRGMEETHETVA